MITSNAEAIVVRHIDESIAVKQRLREDVVFMRLVYIVGMTMSDVFRNGHKLFFMGNGGSAADAQHLAAEFTGRYLRERTPLPAIALNVNTSSLTAIGNDYSFEHVFGRQLEALGVKGDLVVGLTTSGNSANILRAMEVAKSKGLVTVGITGESGGLLKNAVDYCLCIPSAETPLIQEAHIMTGHILCEIVEEDLCG
jgi:D-sedoheptulose 7-phosphate isomerase